MPRIIPVREERRYHHGEVQGLSLGADREKWLCARETTERYKCKKCGVHFVEGDARTGDKVAALKALWVVLYLLGKGSYDMLGKIFGRDRSLIYRWIREVGFCTSEPEIDGEVTKIEFDEMWHLVESKKENFGLSKSLIAAVGGRSQGSRWS
jgi:transposase-like protein